MKKLFLFAFWAVGLMFFFACSKENLDDVSTSKVEPKGSSGDVYLENGYLVMKDLTTADSLLNALSKMTSSQIEAWENSLGLVSARSQYEPLFEEYENISSREEFLAFKAKYANQLSFNESDEEDNSIDYPFIPTPYTPLLNSDGIMKIGSSVFQYTKSGRNAVYDGNLNKLKNIAQYTGDEMVEIQMKSKSSQTSTIDNFSGWRTFGSRRFINELMVEKIRIWYADKEWQRYNRYYLRQRGQKKSIFGWNDYRTVYYFNRLYFKYGTDVTRYTELGDESEELQTAYVFFSVTPIQYSYGSNTTPDQGNRF
ncbi:DUF4848 domain-containing protein [Gaoshiqia sp. Z1-71]|uniref:DUF4848 domain-containing protein n=1 Tax=Gaoshiqia hydrogeniformans TaxID=3290090 RepID=UPI003BF8ED13